MIIGQTVYGDGRYYTAILRSLVVDHDVNFKNDYQLLSITEKLGANGLPANKYQIGPALFWMPTYLLIRPLILGTGYEFPYQLTISLTSVCAAWIGLLVLYRLLKRSVDTTIAIMTTVMIAGATNLLFYGSVDAVNSHAISFLCSSVFLSMIMQSSDARITGSVLGLSLLTRPQEAIGSIMSFTTKKLPYITTLLATATLWYTLQWITWRISYGTWVLNGYAANGEGFHLSFFPLITVLFHQDSGLLLVTPAITAAIAGWFMQWPKKINAYKLPSIGIALIQVLTIAWWSSPTQGASYGSRMFVGTLPYLSLPIAVFFLWLSQKRFEGRTISWFLIMGLTGSNILRVIWFLAGHP
jgi:hypothetical protein